MKTIYNDKLDQHLQIEFLKLGFNYDEIKANGCDTAGENKFKLYSFDYFEAPYLLADGLAVIFTINCPPGKEMAFVEEINASLFNDSSSQKFTPLISQKCLRSEQALPTKSQLLGELKESLKFKTVREKFNLDKSNQDLRMDQNNVRKRMRIYK